MSKLKLIFISFIIQAMGLLGNVIARVAFGNFLSEDQFGIYNIIILIPNLLALLINLGVGHAISMDISKKTYVQINIIKYSYLYSFIVGSIVAIIGFIIFSLIYPEIETYLIFIGSILTTIYLINYFIGFIFLGLQKSYTYFLSVNLIHVLSPLLFLASVFVFEVSLVYAVLSFSLSQLVVNLFLNIRLFTLRNHIIRNEETINKTIRNLVRTGKPFYSTSILSFLNYRIDVFIIGIMLPFHLLSSYTIAVLFIDSFGKITQTISILVFQKIPRLNTMKAKNTLTHQALILNIILNIIAILLLILFSKEIIQFLFPGRYENAYELILYLLPGMFFLSIFRILYHRLAAEGFGESGTWASFWSLLVMIILNILLIPNFEVVGSAIASSISYFIMFVYILFAYKIRTKSL